jgi:hypothetical protein
MWYLIFRLDSNVSRNSNRQLFHWQPSIFHKLQKGFRQLFDILWLNLTVFQHLSDVKPYNLWTLSLIFLLLLLHDYKRKQKINHSQYGNRYYVLILRSGNIPILEFTSCCSSCERDPERLWRKCSEICCGQPQCRGWICSTWVYRWCSKSRQSDRFDRISSNRSAIHLEIVALSLSL